MLIMKVAFTVFAKPMFAVTFSTPQLSRAFDNSTFGTVAFIHHASSFNPHTAILILTWPSFSMKPTWTASE